MQSAMSQSDSFPFISIPSDLVARVTEVVRSEPTTSVTTEEAKRIIQNVLDVYNDLQTLDLKTVGELTKDFSETSKLLVMTMRGLSMFIPNEATALSLVSKARQAEESRQSIMLDLPSE